VAQPNGTRRWAEKVIAGVSIATLIAISAHLANAAVHQDQRTKDQNVRELSREVFRDEVSDLKATIKELQGKIEALLARTGGAK